LFVWFDQMTGTAFLLHEMNVAKQLLARRLEMPANIARSFQSLSDVSQREFGILFDRLSNVWNGWLRSTVISSIIIGTTTALEL